MYIFMYLYTYIFIYICMYIFVYIHIYVYVGNVLVGKRGERRKRKEDAAIVPETHSAQVLPYNLESTIRSSHVQLFLVGRNRL